MTSPQPSTINHVPLRICITGAAGFLGHHLTRTLHAQGHTLKLIDLKPNEEFETIIADVRDTAAMMEHVKDVDVVFHLAALIEAGESVKEPQKYIDSNISATVNILEAMRLNGIKNFAFSSTAAVYGEPERVPIFEDDRTIPINPYGMTKLAIEGLVSSYVASHGFTGVALRYFNLYGPGEKHEPESHAIPRFIKQIYEGNEVTIWGNGEHQRDYIHIADIVSAHLGALTLFETQPNKYHYFNLSTERPCSTLEIVSIIEKTMNKTAHVKHFDARPGDPMVLVADATKAREQLQWQAEVSLEDGLAETVQWFLEQWKK